VQAIAKAQKLPLVGAMAFQQLFDRAGGKKHTESQTALSEAGAGRKDKEASAKELLETGFGIVGGAAQGKSVGDVASGLSYESTQAIMNKYPSLAKKKFDVNDNEVVTNYNNLYYDINVASDGKKVPSKVRAIFRDPKTGSVRVAYATDDQASSGALTVTEPIPKKEFYSKVIRRIAINNPEYDINVIDRVAQDEYQLIDESGGQIDLPDRGPSVKSNPFGEPKKSSSDIKKNPFQ
jgi:hypothetical protein